MFRFFRSKKAPPRPLRVAYDILRMSVGGASGGIKTHHYEFLRYFSEHHGHELSLAVLCREELIQELSFLSAGPYNHLLVIGERGGKIDYRDTDGSFPPLEFWPEPPGDLLELQEIDVLYCGFGTSDFYSTNIPQVSLIIDALHRDLPEALPPEEVAHREAWYQREIARSTLIQTNSKFCVESLKRHYGIPAEKVFHIYAPLHGRFNRVEMGQLPDPLRGLEHKYFLYPANFWPHKNHECLLLGFNKFIHESGSDYHLVLTGSGPPDRQSEIQEIAKSLGLTGRVQFTGHLDSPDFKALWELNAGLIFPSLYEGFGLPLLEAMHFQKPIACHRHQTAIELLGSSASLFDGRKPAEIASALTILAQESKPAAPSPLPNFDFVKEAKSLRDYLKLSSSNPL